MLNAKIRVDERDGVKRMLLAVPGSTRRMQVPMGKPHERFIAATANLHLIKERQRSQVDG